MRQSLGKVERDGKVEAQMEEGLKNGRNEFSATITRVLSKRDPPSPRLPTDNLQTNNFQQYWTFISFLFHPILDQKVGMGGKKGESLPLVRWT